MRPADLPHAMAAASSTVSALGLPVENATILQDSNRVVLRLRPCDVVARVAHVAHQTGAAFEVEVARRLAREGSPVATLHPRVAPQVYLHDGFAITLWSYYDARPRQPVPPADYAHALERLHAGMRQINMATPHFTDRVAEAQGLVESQHQTPDLRDADRQLLSKTLRRVGQRIAERSSVEQVLHGEPHAGNLLRTKEGLRWIDLETACRGPVEFDIAHAPEYVSRHYRAADQGLIRECRILVLAMVASWRWDRYDELPNGRRLALAWLKELRAALER
jgi:hypothetical protein